MHLIKFWGLGLFLAFIPISSVHAQCSRCAALVMNGDFIESDVATEQVPDRYGPASNLQGPIIENKYFASFVSLMGTHVYHDCFGKRKYVPIAKEFINDTDRHHQHDWGTDIWPSGGAPKPGAGFFGALVNGKVIAPNWTNFRSVETKIISDGPEDTKISLTFNDWKVGDETITAVWTLSTNWEARWIKHTFKVPSDFSHSLVFGTTKHLKNEDYVENADAAVLHALATEHTYDFFDEKDRMALIAVKADESLFEEFYYDDIYAGVLVKPNADGLATTWNAVSWAAEPSPLFKDKDWKDKIFQGAD